MREKYCSPECSHLGRVRSHQKWPDRICGQCGRTYRPDHGDRPSRYCSNACQGQAEQRRVPAFCGHCGRAFTVNAFRANTVRFCSHACRAYALSVGKTVGLKNPNRLTFATHYERPYYQRQAWRTKVRDGYRCQKCGKQFQKGDRGIQAHHIVRVDEGGSDHLSNLVSLCTSCHRKEDFRMVKARRSS